MASSPPFTHDSPAPRRQVRTLGPPPSLGFTTSTSEGSLSTHATSRPPPSLPSRIKPFLLRAVTPDRRKNRPLSLDALNEASGSTYRNGASQATSALGVATQGVRRASSRSSMMKGGRGQGVVPRENKVVMMGVQVRERAGSILSSSGRTQTEEVKGRMKQDALSARKERGWAGEGEAKDAGSVRGKRWLAQLVGRKLDAPGEIRKVGSLRDMTNGRQAATTATPSTSTNNAKIVPTVTIESPSPPATLQSRTVTTPVRATTQLHLRGPTVVPLPRASITYVPPATAVPVTTPIKSTASRRQLGVRARPLTADEPIESGAASYSSLQDMLESSGFADTRVVTPIQLPPTNVLPAQTFPLPRDLKSRPSLLSLFAIWSPRAPTPLASPHTSPVRSRPLSTSSESTAHGANLPTANTSPSPTITARNTRALQWIEDVARTTAPPPLPPYVPRTTPPHVRPSLPAPARQPMREITTTKAKGKGVEARTLRHVVSDPTLSLTNAIGNRYGSFGVNLEGRIEVNDNGPIASGSQIDSAGARGGVQWEDRKQSTRRTSTATTPLASTTTTEGWTSWGQSLRTRASDVFLTGLYTSGAAENLRRKELEKEREREAKELPKLLRKAVSSAVLRPVLTVDGAVAGR